MLNCTNNPDVHKNIQERETCALKCTVYSIIIQHIYIKAGNLKTQSQS